MVLYSPTDLQNLHLPGFMSRCAQSRLTLCDPMGCSPPGFCLHGIFPARILEWVAMSPPGNLPDPGIKPAAF